MRRCLIQACRKKDIKNKFHKVPKHLRKKWLRQLQMNPSEITARSAICPIHFTNEDFVKYESKLVLKKDVVPSLNLTVEEIEEEKQNTLTRLETNDFDEVCRTCLNRSGLVPLFELNDEFIDVLRTSTNIQLEQNDNFPQNICSICVHYVTKMYNFVSNCQRINDAFKNCFIKLDHNYFNENTDVTRIKEENFDEIIEIDDDDDESLINKETETQQNNLNVNEMDRIERDLLLKTSEKNKIENKPETDENFIIQEKSDCFIIETVTTNIIAPDLITDKSQKNPDLILNEISGTLTMDKSQIEDLDQSLWKHVIHKDFEREKIKSSSENPVLNGNKSKINNNENLTSTKETFINLCNRTVPNLRFKEVNDSSKTNVPDLTLNEINNQNEDLDQSLWKHYIHKDLEREKKDLELNGENNCDENLDHLLMKHVIHKDLEREKASKIKKLPEKPVCYHPRKNKKDVNNTKKKRLNESTNTTIIRYGSELTTCDTHKLSTMDIVGYECLNCANVFPTYDICKQHIYLDHALPLSKLA